MKKIPLIAAITLILLIVGATIVYFDIKSIYDSSKQEDIIVQDIPVNTVTFDTPDYYFKVRSDECVSISNLAGYFVGREVLAVAGQANSMLILLDNRTILVIMTDPNGNFVGKFVYIDDHKRSE